MGPYYTQSGEEYEDAERDNMLQREPQPKRAKKEFRIERISLGAITARDLYNAVEDRTLTERIEAYRIEVTGVAEWAQALYYPDYARMGITFGGDSTWAWVEGVEQGVDMYLNNFEIWELNN